MQISLRFKLKKLKTDNILKETKMGQFRLEWNLTQSQYVGLVGGLDFKFLVVQALEDMWVNQAFFFFFSKLIENGIE